MKPPVSLTQTGDPAVTAITTIITQVLDEHRWKTMGVSSVECECGEICYGDDSLTQFPADEAFRAHVAQVIEERLGVTETTQHAIQGSNGIVSFPISRERCEAAMNGWVQEKDPQATIVRRRTTVNLIGEWTEVTY